MGGEEKEATLLTLTAQGKPTSYTICIENQNGEPLLPSGKCIGSYIDKKIMKEVFSGKTLTTYATVCTIATTICELKWFGVGWLLGLGESLIGCGLPASMGYLVRGRIAQHLKENGSLGLLEEVGMGSAFAGAYAASSTLNGILYTTTLRSVTARKAAQELLAIQKAEELAKTSKEVKVPKPRLFYTKKFLENTVDSTFRSLTGASLSPEAEARVLASLEPKDYKVLAYICRKGCDTRTLLSIARAGNPRDEIYAKYVERYWESLKGLLEGRISRLGEVVSKKIEAAIPNYIKQRWTKTQLRNFFGKGQLRDAIYERFISKGKLPTKEELRSILSEYGIKKGSKTWNKAFSFLDYASKDEKLTKYKELLELAKKDPKKALEEAKKLGIIKDEGEILKEAKQLENKTIGGIKKRFITTTETPTGEVKETPNEELIERLEESEDPFSEMKKQAQEALQGAGVEEAEKIAKEAAEEALEKEAEEAAENARQGASLVEGIKRNAACLPAGYLAGTIAAALRTGTLNPLSLETLHITIDTDKSTLTINNLKIG